MINIVDENDRYSTKKSFKLDKVEKSRVEWDQSVNSRAKVEHLETKWTVIRIIVASPGQQLP